MPHFRSGQRFGPSWFRSNPKPMHRVSFGPGYWATQKLKKMQKQKTKTKTENNNRKQNKPTPL